MFYKIIFNFLTLGLKYCFHLFTYFLRNQYECLPVPVLTDEIYHFHHKLTFLQKKNIGFKSETRIPDP